MSFLLMNVCPMGIIAFIITVNIAGVLQDKYKNAIVNVICFIIILLIVFLMFSSL